MVETLLINACVREKSRTLELARHVLSLLPGEVEEVKLYEAGLQPLDTEGMKARDDAFRAKDFSDSRFSLARQFASAKTVVIAAPDWDLMFPAVLKTYFEAVTVNGLTFTYGETGIPVGLCRAERLIYVTTAGGPIFQNFGYEYACALGRSFYGIKDAVCIRAEGLDIRGANVEEILRKAKESATEVMERACL